MNIDSIANGIVIDHIKAGNGMEIYRFLNLDALDCQVVVIKNASSRKMGKKDIIKIDADLKIDLDVLGYIDPHITVNIIKNGKLERKEHISLPEKITNVLKCRNPRCITSCEQGIVHTFKLADKENAVYRCIYCDAKAKDNAMRGGY